MYSLISTLCNPASDGGTAYRSFIIGDEASENGVWDLRMASVHPVLVHPKSRGNIRLKSNNPKDPPVINPQTFSDPLDIKVMVTPSSFSLGESKFFRQFGAWFYESLEFCKQFTPSTAMPIGNVQYRYNTFPYLHDVSTCEMGPAL